MANAQEIANKHGLVFSFNDDGTPQVKQVFNAEHNPEDVLRAAVNCCIKGSVDEGIGLLIQLLENKEYRLSALQNLANCYYDKDEFEKALEYCTQALEADQKNPFSHRTLCKIYIQMEDLKLAEKHLILGTVLQPKVQEATILHDEITAYKNKLHEYHRNAVSHRTSGQIFVLDEKVDDKFKEYFMNKFVEFGDQDDIEFRSHIYDGLFGDIDSDIKNPVIVFAYEWLKNCGYTIMPYTVKEWDQTKHSLDNRTLLVYSEQGLGDNILRLSIIKQIKEQYKNCKILFVTYSSMRQLAESCDYIDRVLPMVFDVEELTSVDYTTNIMGITRWYDLQYKEPHLPKMNHKVFDKSDKRNIIVNWKCRRKTRTSKRRQIDLAEFCRVLNSYKKHFNFYICQHKSELKQIKSDIEEYKLPVEILDSDDITDLFSYIEASDIVVTIDTVHAHIAGGLNKKVFMLLPSNMSFPHWGKGLVSVPYYDSLEILRGKNHMSKLQNCLSRTLTQLNTKT